MQKKNKNEKISKKFFFFTDVDFFLSFSSFCFTSRLRRTRAS